MLVRHPHDQAANLGEDSPTAAAIVRVGPLPNNELPMPPQDRAWCHDGGDLLQDLSSQPVLADRQASPVGISEPDPLLTQLASKDAVLLHQIRERLPLLAIQPAGEDGEQHVESRRVDHDGSL
jgi:hypothetical protein